MAKRAVFIWLLVAVTSAEGRWVRSSFEGIRPTGMGNAFLAIADGKEALWYNPAGLARIKSHNFDIYDVIAGFDSTDTLSRLYGALAKQQLSSALRADKQFGRFGFYPTYFGNGFGASVYYQVQTFLEIENFDLPEVDLYGANDLGVILGGSFPLTDSFSVGLSLRGIQRTGADLTQGSNAFLSSLNTNETNFAAGVYDAIRGLLGKGYALGLNAGALWRIPTRNKQRYWQLAATAEDLGQTTFRAASGSRPPPPIRGSYNVGTAFTTPLSRVALLNVAADLRHLGEGLSFIKTLHIGAEVKYGPLAIRAGAYQGNAAFGLGFEMQPFRLNFSTYAVELGERWLERYHRWYLAQVVVGLGGLRKR